MASRTTLNISLTPELQKLLDEKLATGRYESAGEVVRDGLRLVEQRDRLLAIEELRAKIDVGWQQSESGQGRDGEQVFAQMRKLLIAKLGGKGRASARRKSA